MHRRCDTQLARSDQLLQNGASREQQRGGVFGILYGDGLHERCILGGVRSLACRDFGNGGPNIGERGGEVSELRIIYGPFDGAAFGMTQNNNRFGTGQFGREFQATNDIGVDEIPGDAGAEDIADLLIEDQFRRHSAIDAPNNGRERRLSRGGRPNLRHQIAVNAATADEAGIAVLEPLQRAA